MDEIIIARALEGIAAGATRAEVRADIVAGCNLQSGTIETLLHDALIEAENQGVEREDIDPSWYRR